MARRLRSRANEIEAAIVTRVLAISDTVTDDAEYMTGLRAAITAAVSHGLKALECADERSLPVPAALLVQARLAARMSVPLETVLRRYFAGYTLLLDYLVAEARESEVLGVSALQVLVRAQSLVHESVVAAVSEEYARERKQRIESSGEHRTNMVKRLLAGELLESASFDYEFEGFQHHGAVARGAGGGEVLRRLADSLGCRRLVVAGEPEVHWGWLGAREAVDTKVLAEQARRLDVNALTVAIAEPAAGISGWRLTHKQARAAMAVALRRGDSVVRYADVALVASMLHDELLAQSLRSIYLEPLAKDRDGGAAARRTLRAYFKAGRNVSSAAAALEINRQTVSKRLREIEDKLGDALINRAADLEAALRLEELMSPPEGGSSPAAP